MPDILAEFFNHGDFSSRPAEYELDRPFALCVMYDGSLPKERGAVMLQLSDDALYAEGMMADCDLFSRANGDGQKLWELGDAFEFMVRLPGHEDYHEFQASPNGFRLQLHIEDYRTIRQVPHEKKLCDCWLQVVNAIDVNKHIWRSRMTIPLAGLGTDRRGIMGAELVFVRQNHSHGAPKPEITTTQVFSSTVHVPDRWLRLRVKDKA